MLQRLLWSIETHAWTLSPQRVAAYAWFASLAIPSGWGRESVQLLKHLRLLLVFGWAEQSSRSHSAGHGHHRCRPAVSLRPISRYA